MTPGAAFVVAAAPQAPLAEGDQHAIARNHIRWLKCATHNLPIHLKTGFEDEASFTDLTAKRPHVKAT